LNVICNDIDEFCAELFESQDFVASNIVRIQTNKIQHQEEGITGNLLLTATSLIDRGQYSYLLEVTENAGEYGNGSPDNGQDTADRWINKISQLCDELKLKVCGGRIEA
jgi:hypothetical protein